MIGDAQCTALIAGVPVENLYKTLSLGLDESLIFSHIVRKDGTFVVKNYSSGVDTDTIYEWYRKNCRESGIENIDERIDEMEQNILNRTPYSLETAVNGEQRHVYTSPLPHTEMCIRARPCTRSHQNNRCPRQWRRNRRPPRFRRTG